MYEVFNYLTGETIGYCEHRATAAIYCRKHPECDYINADEESSGGPYPTPQQQRWMTN